MRQVVAQVEQDDESITDFLQDTAPRLTDHAKSLMIKAAIMIGSADDEFCDEGKALLIEISNSLYISES